VQEGGDRGEARAEHFAGTTEEFFPVGGDVGQDIVCG